MPPEVIPVIAIVFGCGLGAISIIFKFAKWKTEHNTERLRIQQGLDNSMTTGELQNLIAGAVSDATADLQAEIKELRAEKQGRLSLDDFGDDPFEMPDQVNTPRQRY